MSRKDKEMKPDPTTVDPISAPSGLDLNPKPQQTRRVSKRAGAVIIAIAIFLALVFAYGGYKRSQKAKATAAQSGVPKALAPATAASHEFTKGIPAGNAAVTKGRPPEELEPPEESKKGSSAHNNACSSDPKTGQPYRFDPLTGQSCDTPPAGCGFDPRTGQRYRFDPLTGQPCNGQTAPLERVAIRRAPASPYAASQQPSREPSREERQRQEFYRREQEAMQAPTGVHFTNSGSLGATTQNSSLPTSQSDLAQVAALGAALSTQRNAEPSGVLSPALLSSSNQSNAADYDGQNAQTRKEQFIESTASKKTDDYLKSLRTAPLSAYEIKAGWEIPAVLEQSLNSDLPGEIKALVMSNVYDTATGQYLLIPQGSRLIGKYDSRVSYGQDGVQVTWSRIIFPDASSVDLAGMEGLDSHGNAGLRDKVDRHYKRLFGFAALTSAFTAAFEISQRRNQSVLSYPSPSETASASVGREMSETGAMMTRRNLNVQPTIKVPAGYKFTVRVNRDILFDAPYEPETANPEVLPSPKELRRRTSY